MRHSYWQITAAMVMLTGGAYACSGDNQASPAPSATAAQVVAGGGGNSAARGALTIRLTDSPFSEAKSLLVTFSEVSVHRADPGEWVTLPFASGSSRTCDLKKLEGATDLLGIGELAAGKYTQIRLTVATAKIFFDSAAMGGACATQIVEPTGTSAAVDIPSGVIKLNNEFTITSAGTTILLDFDGDRSVRQTGGGNGNGNGSSHGNRGNQGRYMMSPVIRVVSVQ